MIADLVRSLIDADRVVTDEEVEQILQRIETAPFNPASVAVRPRHRALSYQGRRLEAHEPSLVYHLVKRVLVDEQWAVGTTGEEYIADLRRAIRITGARLLVYRRWDEHVAAVAAPNPVPVARLGPKARALLYVVYSADRDIILTGYQVGSVDRIRLPEDARWLR